MSTKQATKGFVHALATTLYVIFVGWFMSNAQSWFQPSSDVWGVVFILLLLVVSAAVTGGLVLGKPLLWYLSGNKLEALQLFAWTMVWLVAGLVIILIAFIV